MGGLGIMVAVGMVAGCSARDEGERCEIREYVSTAPTHPVVTTKVRIESNGATVHEVDAQDPLADTERERVPYTLWVGARWITIDRRLATYSPTEPNDRDHAIRIDVDREIESKWEKEGSSQIVAIVVRWCDAGASLSYPKGDGDVYAKLDPYEAAPECDVRDSGERKPANTLALDASLKRVTSQSYTLSARKDGVAVDISVAPSEAANGNTFYEVCD